MFAKGGAGFGKLGADTSDAAVAPPGEGLPEAPEGFAYVVQDGDYVVQDGSYVIAEV